MSDSGFVCELCGKICKDLTGLSIHLSKIHKYKLSDTKRYYDKYFNADIVPKCYFCDNDARFLGITKGYHRICGCDVCLGKTRASTKPEFWVYKLGISLEEAIIYNDERMRLQGETVKRVFKEMLKDDPNFNKKRSHQTKEFWINKGYSEEIAILKASEVMKDIHKKTSIKKKDNYDYYKDSYNTTKDYYTKRGYNDDEAENMLKERQTTFTLDSCILKYGEVEGKNIYEKRQSDWSEKMVTKYKNGEYNKSSNRINSKPELELFDEIIRLTNIEAKYGKNQYCIYDSSLGRSLAYDFYYNDKIIEFNGDYWHCNPDIYEYNYVNKHKKKFACEIWELDEIKNKCVTDLGIEILVIWERDYKYDKNCVIQKCIEFLIK